jgi:hypothetical protein
MATFLKADGKDFLSGKMVLNAENEPSCVRRSFQLLGSLTSATEPLKIGRNDDRNRGYEPGRNR